MRERLKLRCEGLLSSRQGQVDPEREQGERLSVPLNWKKARAAVLYCIILYL